MDFNPVDIKKLASLLKVEGEDSSDDDSPQCSGSKLGPGDIKPKSLVKVRVPTEEYDHTEKKQEKRTRDPKAIWTVDEVQSIPFCDDASYDPRETPEFDIKYRQAVTSEDVFLQLGRKNTSTASCEVMVITVKLEGERREDIDLHLTKQHLDLRSPLYRLSLPLPHPSCPDSSNAEWDPNLSTLAVSVALNRELDFTNF